MSHPMPGGSAVTERNHPSSPTSSAVGSDNLRGNLLPSPRSRAIRLPALSQALGLGSPTHAGENGGSLPPPGCRLGQRQGRQRARRAGRAPGQRPVFSAQHPSAAAARTAGKRLRICDFHFSAAFSIIGEYKLGSVICIATGASELVLPAPDTEKLLSSAS